MQGNRFIIEISRLWELLKTPLINFNEVPISVITILFALLTVVISYILSKKLALVIKLFLSKRGADSGVSDSVGQFVKIIIIIIGFVAALSILGFSLKSLTAISAVLMVGIGFGLQNIAQNFISGIIILIERPIKVGDIILIGSVTGRVIDIRVRSTIVQTRDDISIIVPNSKLIAEDVVNESFTGSNIRLQIEVGVAYGSDVDLVKSILLKAAKNNSDILETPISDVILNSFGDSSLNFELRVWTNEIWQQKKVCSDIRFDIYKLFREENIQIPFPQQDIYIKHLPLEK